jgi:hypothetical protein
MDGALGVNTLAHDAKDALSALLFSTNPSSAIGRHSAAAARKKPARMGETTAPSMEKWEALSAEDKVASIYYAPDIPRDDKPVLLMAALVGKTNFDNFVSGNFPADAEKSFSPIGDGFGEFYELAAETEEEARSWLYEETKGLYEAGDAEFEKAEEDLEALQKKITSELKAAVDQIIPTATGGNMGDDAMSDEEVMETSDGLLKVLEASKSYDEKAGEFFNNFEDSALEEFLDKIESGELNDDGIEQLYNKLSNQKDFTLPDDLEEKLIDGQLTKEELKKAVGDEYIDEDTIALRELAAMNDARQAEFDDYVKKVKAM